ncbi:hypothetical protein CFN78_08475 [Amycolatopsis antarctica]|uniref:ARB-07466-like C-terminal domain-containing protein n=1 Tax=Amycolatopsis antarctica TaxID=1854586 RepID=A0A263D4Z3_9PSEU|nr:hypothetical protein [Amycolatopsis antarctica]OZM73562.1 hypothetical protein CFN78_08475 [Amycolatopsis antarctica]
MTGRHRKRSRSWVLPSVIAAAAASVLMLAAWFTGGIANDATTGQAAAALSMRTAPSTTTAPPAPPSSTTTTPPPPVTTTTEPEPTTEEPPPTTESPEPTTTTEEKKASCPTSLEGTKPHVAQVGNHVKGKFDVDSVGGKAGRSGDSDHPSGLALDFMVGSATGDEIAEYVLDNQEEFGVEYVIWKQRYNDGGSWSTMEDRGDETANHFDHVHVSFESGADVSVTC